MDSSRAIAPVCNHADARYREDQLHAIDPRLARHTFVGGTIRRLAACFQREPHIWRMQRIGENHEWKF